MSSDKIFTVAVVELIEHSLNSSARISGTAVANIGEFYANFGPIGIMIGMIILGLVARKVKNYFLVENTENENSLIIYSIIYPLLFQWIARGNFCGNFYVTIFALLPFVFILLQKKL